MGGNQCKQCFRGLKKLHFQTTIMLKVELHQMKALMSIKFESADKKTMEYWIVVMPQKRSRMILFRTNDQYKTRL